jgi:hypothetical protein
MSVLRVRATILLLVAGGIAGCGGATDPPGTPTPVCKTPVEGIVQMLYPIPGSVSVADSGGVVIYGIADPFPSSSTVSGTGPFPITIANAAGGAVAVQQTPLPSPLPSPMATPKWPSDQPNQVYAVWYSALNAKTSYSVTASVPGYTCSSAGGGIQNGNWTLGSFTTQ